MSWCHLKYMLFVLKIFHVLCAPDLKLSEKEDTSVIHLSPQNNQTVIWSIFEDAVNKTQLTFFTINDKNTLNSSNTGLQNNCFLLESKFLNDIKFNTTETSFIGIQGYIPLNTSNTQYILSFDESLIIKNITGRKYNCNPVFFDSLRECNPNNDDIIVTLCESDDFLSPMNVELYNNGSENTAECSEDSCVTTQSPLNETAAKPNGTEVSLMVQSLVRCMVQNASNDFREKLKEGLKLILSDNENLNIMINNGRTSTRLLNLAVILGNTDIVSALLESGADPALTDRDGQGALHACAAQGSVEMMKVLIDSNRTNVNQQAADGETALHFAAAENKADMFELLLQKGADPYISEENGLTALHVAASVDLELVKMIVARSNVGINKADIYRRTALYMAVSNENIDVVEFLLKSGSDPNIPDMLGRSPIIISLTQENEEITTVLLKNGADIYFSNNPLRLTPLHMAVQYHHYTIVELMLKINKEGIDSLNRMEATPLQMAVMETDNKMIKILLDNGADPYARLFGRDWTILHLIAEKGFLEVGELILSVNSTGIDYQNDLGQTALYRSVLRNNTEIFDLFLRYDANVTIGTNNKFTPLMVAANLGNYLIAKNILNVTNEVVNDQNGFGETALLLAAKNNQTEIFELILKSGGKSYIPSNDGSTCLHAAASVSNKRIAEMILKDNSTVVNIQDNEGKSALHITIQDNNIDLFKYLLSEGANPYIENSEGFTLLQKLVIANSLDFVDALVKINNKGINYRSNRAMTAVYIATVLRNSPMVKTLMQYGADPYISDELGRNALHNAVFLNETQIAEIILSVSNRGINMRDSGGLTALQFARDNPRMCELLLKYDADIFIASNDGMTALHSATDLGILETVVMLLDANASIADVKDNNDQIALHFAAVGNNSDIFDALLNSTKNPFEKNIVGLTAMHMASEKGHSNYVEKLLNLNNSFVNFPAYDGHTALHYATSKNHTEVVELLLQAGADPRIFDYSGYTAHHFAVSNGLLHLLELFLSINSADVNVQTMFGTSLISMAAEENQEAIVDFLLERSADLSLTNDFGQTILHAALHGRNVNILLKVLNKTVNLINHPDIDGRAPIHMATEIPEFFDIIFSRGGDPLMTYFGFNALLFSAFKGYNNISKTILDKCSECVKSKNHVGINALAFAVFGKNRESVELLMKRGVDIYASNFFDENILHYSFMVLDSSILVDTIMKEMNKSANNVLLDKLLNQKNAEGLTPLAKAAVNGNEYVFQNLLQAGSSLHTISIRRETLLHYAAKGGSEYIIRTVVNGTNISVGSKNYDGVTPLMNAAEGGSMEAFEFLIRHGASLHDVSRYNETILHFAAIGGSVHILKAILMSENFVIDATDVEGYTPLMLACIHGRVEAAAILTMEHADPVLKNVYDESPIGLAAALGNQNILNLFRYSRVQYDKLLGFVLAQNKPLDEEFVSYLLSRSSISKHPLFISAALGDDVALLKALKIFPLARKIRFPHLMKQLMKEYDSLIEELLVDDPIYLSGYDNYITPLDVALLFFGNMSTVKLIIDYFQINISALQKHRSMWSPLDLAMCSMTRFTSKRIHKTQILYFLLNVDETLPRVPNVYGWTVSHKAAWFGNSDVVTLLKKKRVDLQTPDRYGRTPLHIAALKGYRRIVNLILRDSKESINRGDLYGFTPLHLLQIYGRRKFFTRLSFAKSDMDIQDRFAFVEKVDPMDGPLGARTRSYLDTMILLIDNGADINAQDNTFGWTPLHWAAINGDVWKTVTLVGKGALLNKPSRTGVTPLFLARSWGRTVIYHFLKSKEGVW